MKLLAPNGKPSNLTPEQYRLVRTPAFKKWFGDWENSPETASKVVDEETKEPLVVYHGTNEDFFTFNPYLEGERANVKRTRLGGSYFSSKYMVANSFVKTKFKKPIILSLFLNFRNDTIIVNANSSKLSDLTDWNKELIRYSKENVIIKDTYDDAQTRIISDIFITSNPNNIKLADGTNTTFDSNNPDIRFNDGGEIKITSDKLHDRTEDTYSIGKSYADVTKGNNSWSINYIESRSKGDGSKLINKIIDDAKKQNVSHINLQTGNGSETFFMKFGFQVTEEDNGYFYMKWSNPDIRFDKGGKVKTLESEAKKYKSAEEFVIRYADGGLIIEPNERTEYNGYKVGDVIESEQLLGLSGGSEDGGKGKKYILIQSPLSDIELVSRQDIYDNVDNDPEYMKSEDWRIEEMKKDFDKTPPIPYNGDGLHRIVSAKELGHKTILMWKEYNPNLFGDGGLIETLTTEQVEQKLGRKLHWWNDDVVSINGVKYKKVYLRPEYKKV